MAQLVAELEAEIQQRNMLSAELVREECRRIVAFNVKKMFREDGTPIPIHELPDEVAACISSIEYEVKLERVDAAGDVKYSPVQVTKIRFWSKNSSIDSAARMLGLFRDKLILEQNPIKELMDRIQTGGPTLPATP